MLGYRLNNEKHITALTSLYINISFLSCPQIPLQLHEGGIFLWNASPEVSYHFPSVLGFLGSFLCLFRELRLGQEPLLMWDCRVHWTLVCDTITQLQTQDSFSRHWEKGSIAASSQKEQWTKFEHIQTFSILLLLFINGHFTEVEMCSVCVHQIRAYSWEQNIKNPCLRLTATLKIQVSHMVDSPVLSIYILSLYMWPHFASPSLLLLVSVGWRLQRPIKKEK